MSDQTDTTRPLMKADYPTIYDLIEGGAPLEVISKVYNLSIPTIKKRLSADRPKLFERFKEMTTSVRVEKDDTKRALAVMQAAAQVFKLDLTDLIGHDINALAERARKQRAAKEKDPNVELTALNIDHARAIASHVKSLSALPEMGLQSGSNTSVTVNQVNHASVMRRGDNSNILADEDELAGAIVDVESEEIL